MDRILGIDFGSKRIGLAVSDPLGLTAQGIGVAHDLKELHAVIIKYPDLAEIVIGLPKKMDGSLGPQAEKVLALADELKAATGLKVSTWDERLTTAEAEKMLISAGVSRAKRKQVIDQSAAVVILQSYMDRQARGRKEI